MVLRKNPPPGINVPPRTRNGSDPRSPVSRTSASPRSATQQSSRKDSWELDTDSIYSPDLHTSPAFDLMPLEQAQKSPVASQSPWEDELVERPAGMAHAQPGVAADQINYQHTGLSVQSVDDPQKQADSALGTSPQRFRSNNPFLRPRNPSPNPWDDASQQLQPNLGQGTSVSSLHPDASERNSQSSFPMSLFFILIC
jgi:ubiquitin carboxyl-terminal hydrolase MINDY-1/2